jgi:DNA/RNA endonuclease YhcR with UshA esterase domain
MKPLLILLALTFCACTAKADYTGTVSELKQFSGGAEAIDLDGAYPNQKMTLYIHAADLSKFTKLPKEGDTVTAKGPITSYKGRPEIVIDDPSQLTW